MKAVTVQEMKMKDTKPRGSGLVSRCEDELYRLSIIAVALSMRAAMSSRAA